MPKSKIDYSKGLVYKIVCKDTNIQDCYVGSTTNFIQRKYEHKSSLTNPTSDRYNSKLGQQIHNNGNWKNWDMILVEEVPCTNSFQLHARERHYIETLKPTLNTQLPTRS